MSEQVRVIWGRFDELAARAQLSRIAVLDSVKQDVRFTDKHLGRSAEVIVAV
jgi:hypothetical protein